MALADSNYKLAPCHTKSTPKTDLHCTPKAFFEYLQKQLKSKFTIDIAADKHNTLCKKFIDQKQNALNHNWEGIAWCNPPYSQATAFVRHCYGNSARFGSTAMLMAARTDTDWWTYTKHAYLIIYIKGRLKFKGAKAGAPFPSVVIVFKKGWKGQTKNIYLSPSPYERGFERGKPK